MFFFGGRKKAPGPPRPARIVEPQRRAFRAAVEFELRYALAGRDGTRTAIGEDLSASGLRLIGDEDLREGSVIELRFTLPNERLAGVLVEREVDDVEHRPRSGTEKTPKKKLMVPPDPFAPMALRGRVVVPFLSVRRRKFAHGIEFLGIDPGDVEEIQRFIHVWQLKGLRDRRVRRGLE